MPCSDITLALVRIDGPLLRDPFASLAVEVIHQILHFLHPVDIFSFSQTCKSNTEVALADTIWARNQWARCVNVRNADDRPDVFFAIYACHLVNAGRTLGWWAVDLPPTLNMLLRSRVTFKLNPSSHELEYYFLTTVIPTFTSTVNTSLADHPLLRVEAISNTEGSGPYIIAATGRGSIVLHGYQIKPRNSAVTMGSTYFGTMEDTQKDTLPAFLNFCTSSGSSENAAPSASFNTHTYSGTFDEAPFPSPAVKPAVRTQPGLLLHPPDALKICAMREEIDAMQLPIYPILAPSDFPSTPHDLIHPGIYITPSNAGIPWEYMFVHVRALTEDDFKITWPWEGSFSTQMPKNHRDPSSEVVDWSDPANHLGPFSDLFSYIGASPSPLSLSHVLPGARILEVIKITGNDRVPKGQRSAIAFLDDPLVPPGALDHDFPEKPDEQEMCPWPLDYGAVIANDPDPSHLIQRPFAPTRGVDVPGKIRVTGRGLTRPSWEECTIHVESRTQFSVWWSDMPGFVRIYTKLEEW